MRGKGCTPRERFASVSGGVRGAPPTVPPVSLTAYPTVSPTVSPAASPAVYPLPSLSRQGKGVRAGVPVVGATAARAAAAGMEAAAAAAEEKNGNTIRAMIGYAAEAVRQEGRARGSSTDSTPQSMRSLFIQRTSQVQLTPSRHPSLSPCPLRLHDPCRGREGALRVCSHLRVLAGGVWRVDTRAMSMERESCTHRRRRARRARRQRKRRSWSWRRRRRRRRRWGFWWR